MHYESFIIESAPLMKDSRTTVSYFRVRIYSDLSREMLNVNQALDMATQLTIFNTILEERINHPPSDPSLVSIHEQIDDIIVVGVRF